MSLNVKRTIQSLEMSNKKESVESGSKTVDNSEAENNELPEGDQEVDKNPESKKRKLHKTYITGWKEDISRQGFARCLIASCNFMSSNVLTLQSHHKICDGIPVNGEHLCNYCWTCLSTEEELMGHKIICKKAPRDILKLVEESSDMMATNYRSDDWTSEDEDENQGFENNSIVEVKLSEDNSKSSDEGSNFSLFCCIHCRCGFPTKEDHIKHQENCSVAINVNSRSKKPDNLHFRVIKQMKSKDSNDDCIIQPGPELAEGEYRRRRAYRAEHKNSWAIALEKYKYVKCLYQNCYFIAMSLEDMIAHYGYCNGDGSFAKFVCLYCNGRVTSEAILLKHVERSHYTEKVKVEHLTHKIGDDVMNSRSNTRKSKENFEHKKKSNKPSKGGQSPRQRIWKDHIKEHGYEYCQKSLCNFMTSDVSELENHLKTCDGTPNFDLYCCQKCSYRLSTKKEFVRHAPFCNDDTTKYFSAAENQKANPQPERMEEDDFEIRPVVRQYESKRPKSHTKHHKSNFKSTSKATESEYVANKSTNATKNSGGLKLNSKETPKPKTRGRPKKNKEEMNTPAEQEIEVKCAKCQFRGSKSKFIHHNFKMHVGLGWIVGEEPVDLNNEKLVIRLVKEAFKYTKKAVCEKCDDIKRSVLGFVSHIQNCGKSEEEKNALKVQCPHCEGKYLKYSLSTHIKLIHSAPEEKEQEKKEVPEEISSGKRRSAVKAVSKFQQSLDDNDEPESNEKVQYIYYEKGNERLPKLNAKLNNLWYKLKRDKKKIPCRHPNCHNLSEDVKEAKNHHYRCPLLPNKVFLCELCDFYSVKESAVQSHVTTHRKYVNQRKSSGEEVMPEEEENEEDNDKEDDEEVEEEEEEEEASEEEDFDEFRKRKKKSTDSRGRKKPKISIEAPRSIYDLEFRLKQSFCRREKIDNIRGIRFFSSGLDMTLQEDLLISKSSENWKQLHTTLQDWCHAPDKRFLPKLTRSISVRLPGDETNWRRFERLESDLIGGIPVMFAGGSIRSMSWCKISCKRMMEITQKQYLAVTTAKKFNYLKDIYEKSLEKDNLLQIWDCGPLNNDLTKVAPKFSLGIVHPGGEVWDVKWFPQDTHAEGTKVRLTRLGLLATACEDGVVRVWSVCDPQQLKNTKGLPIYKTDPVVTLVADDVDESCFQLSVGLDGIIAGGFGNGNIAVWNLKNISSPFCKKLEKCRIIRAHLVFQAHKTAITALTFCPLNSRYLSTAGLDRFVKTWDLEFPFVPVELFNKEYSLDNIWTMNWPSIIYNFDDVVINYNKGAVKFIKDIFTDRHQSTFGMKDTCLSLSFSDWLNALCGGSITGEVKLRLLKNLFHDQKRSQSTISSIQLEKLENGGSEKGTEKSNDFPKTYSEVVSEFGLAFKDNLGMDIRRPEKHVSHPEEFPIRAVNKTVFNPNFESFTHIALGYNCGLIRIQPLKELQSTMSLKFFLAKTLKKNF